MQFSIVNSYVEFCVLDPPQQIYLRNSFCYLGRLGFFHPTNHVFLHGEVSLLFQLYDGPRWMGRYCGVDLPPPGSTTSSKLQVLLLTDGVGRHEKGFQMQWFVYGKPGADLSCICSCYLTNNFFFFSSKLRNNTMNK